MSSSKKNKLLISYSLVRRHTSAALRISRQGEMPKICQNVEGETCGESFQASKCLKVALMISIPLPQLPTSRMCANDCTTIECNEVRRSCRSVEDSFEN